MPSNKPERPVRVTLEGMGLEIEVIPGISLFEAVRKAGLAIDSDCAGKGTCGQCRVHFLENVPPAKAEDESLLSPEEVADGWRLACQSYPQSDCRILIPQATPQARRRKIRVLTTAIEEELAHSPEQRTTATGYGVAIDVGTTTVVCYLMDLSRSLQVGVSAFANPQKAFGPDVISRITYAHRGPRELRELQHRLIAAIERNLVALCAARKIAPESVSTVTVAGNMTMMHLFRGVNPWSLGVAPYEPVFLESPPLAGRELGFHHFAAAKVQVLPGIGGHLGSDIVAGVLALDLPHRPGVSLFMDLGTNGEVVLCSGSILAGVSCAAGPAFEGVHIHSGMAAFPGAVERVDEVDGTLRLDTIEGAEPIGLCGSGLADAVVLLVRRGILLRSGRFVAPDEVPPAVPADLRRRMQEDSEGRRFLLHKNGERGDIVLMQRDIREVQLAKAPMRAGVEVLLNECGVAAAKIEAVYVAGAFGSSIRSESLLALGVVPESVRGRIHAVGNTAGLGARLALTSPEHLAEAGDLARSIRHVDLVMRDDFREAFAENIPFP